MDTGQCIPEALATLLAQQSQLVTGRRDAQMFPLGTDELPLPEGMARHKNGRGIFHFRPERLTCADIETLSRDGRENEILLLGPYSKPEIAHRVRFGEQPVCISERTPEGVEIRTAVGTVETMQEQIDYFEITKDDPSNVVEVVELLPMIKKRMAR
jgi:hypothetical protein